MDQVPHQRVDVRDSKKALLAAQCEADNHILSPSVTQTTVESQGK